MSWLGSNEKKSPAESTDFGSEDVIKTVEAVGECLAVVPKSIPCHQYKQLYGPGNVRGIPRNADVAPRKLQIAGRVWDIPGWDRWGFVGDTIWSSYVKSL
jgi:hypothetical protein